MKRDHLYRNKDYKVKIADDDQEKEQAYKLRYEVFHHELNECPANSKKIDKDEYDDFCDHLILMDKENDVIATYRMLPWNKVDPKLGYYSEQEFDFINMPKKHIVELGRLCIKKEYRKSHLLLVLWIGLNKYLRKNKIRYLFGCVSLRKNTSSEDLSIIYSYLRKRRKISKRYKVEAKVPPPKLESTLKVTKKRFMSIAPRLVTNYLKLSMVFLGPPGYDPVFQIYDLLGMLSVR